MISHKYGHICVGFFLILPQLQSQLRFSFPILIVEANVCNNLRLVRVDFLGSLQIIMVYLSFRSLSTSRGRCSQCLQQRASWLRRGPSTYWPTLGRGSWTGAPRGDVWVGVLPSYTVLSVRVQANIQSVTCS